MNERVSVWGVAGYGEGELTLTPSSPKTGEAERPVEAGLNLAMGAPRVREVVVEAPADGGVELSVTSDAMVVRTITGAVHGEGGNLAEADANVTRLRLGLDAGAGLAWADPRSGLSATVRGRGTLAGLAADDTGDALENRRLELRLGYGFSAFAGRSTSTPELKMGLSNAGRDYRLGWRLALDRCAPVSLELGLEATRREPAADGLEAAAGPQDPEHGIDLRLSVRW